MKKLLAVLLMCLSLSAIAASKPDAVPAGWDTLSETQKAEFRKQVAVAAEENQKTALPATVPDLKKVDEWVGLGERIGKMMGGAAREVGVAINEFVNTPVGMMTMMLIVWKFMGGTLVHLVGGVLVWLIGACVMGFIYRRMLTRTIEYDVSKTNIFGNHPRIRMVREALSSDQISTMFFGSVAFVLGGIAVIFSY